MTDDDDPAGDAGPAGDAAPPAHALEPRPADASREDAADRGASPPRPPQAPPVEPIRAPAPAPAPAPADVDGDHGADSADSADGEAAPASAPPGSPAGNAAAHPAPPEPPAEPDLWDRGAAWTMQHGALPALGLITLGMVAIYWHMFAGELAGDDLSFHMAESARLADCLRAFDFDLWNPSANAGFASAYYYQVVPQLISAIPAAVFGHHVFFFELSVFLPLVLAPAAAYRGMRLLGATPWQAAIAALAVGFTNGESRWGTGNAGTFQVGLYTQTWALAAFPLALGHAARWATEARGLAPAIAWGAFVTLCHPFAGVALGAALLAGWLAQIVLLGLDELLAEIGHGLGGGPRPGVIAAIVAHLGERWRRLPPRPWLGELRRLAILAACLFVAWMPVWLPLMVDYAGFGGFPHRVNDEVGPGFTTLGSWYVHGAILDFARPVVLTWTLPIVALLARARFLRWLWAPILVYAVWLGLGPHLGKTDDDLIPAVRFLGAMQVAMSLAAGAGALLLMQRLWHAEPGGALARCARPVILGLGLAVAAGVLYAIWTLPEDAEALAIGQQLSLGLLSGPQVRWVLLIGCLGLAGAGLWLGWTALHTPYAIRTSIAAAAAALVVLLALPGGRALASRVHVLADYDGSHGNELHIIAQRLQTQPPGRKQVGKGAENHWWNLLSYEYGRRPALLMMGGGGLQASPNYDFLWSNAKEFAKDAWVYDAPYLVFQKSSASEMPPGEPVFETKNYTVRRLPAPGLVSPVEVTGTLPAGTKRTVRAAALDWFRTDQPLHDRVLAYAGSGGPGGPPHATVARAFRQDSPGDAADIYAIVDATAPTTVMARESWHPRWHAYVDGAPATVRRVTPDFPAVDVPAGHHVLALRFERPWWAQAAWLAWPLLPLAAWLLTRRRRPLPPAA
jgi:hypothetical protein